MFVVTVISSMKNVTYIEHIVYVYLSIYIKPALYGHKLSELLRDKYNEKSSFSRIRCFKDAMNS